jgi:hypothetical protein
MHLNLTDNIAGDCSDNKRMKDLVYLLLLIAAGVIMMFQFFNTPSAQGQFIPLPPPGPDSQPAQQKQIGKYDSMPPTIEFLTTSLRQGKNVIKVKVLDDAPIDFVQIKEAINGKVIANEMVADPNNIYKFLIDVTSPSKIIVVRAFDINGNYSETVKKFDVPVSSNLIDSIRDFFGGILSR